MTPTEIIAYKGEDEFGEIEVFVGTKEQIAQLRKQLRENWRDIGGEKIKMVYRGKDYN